MNKFENLIETKLTRTEILDMLIHEMAEDMQAAVRAGDETCKALDQYRWDEVSALFDDKADVEVHHWDRGRKDDRIKVEVSVVLPYDKIPAKLRKHLAEFETADKERDEAREAVRRIHGERGALKSRMLREMLSQTEEGKSLLQLLDGMKTAARKQLKAGGAR
jgi:hypothetical protein